MDFRKGLVLSYHIVAFLSSIIVLYFTTDFLFLKKYFKKSTHLSPIMILYFVYGFCFGSTMFLYCSYYLIFWRPDTVIYDSQLLFLFGFLPFLFVSLNPWFECFLCLDRAIAIIVHVKYKKKHQIWLLLLVLSFVFVPTVLILYDLFKSFPKTNEVTLCQYFTCLIKSPNNLTLLKFISIGCSLTSAIIFALLLKFKFTTTNKIIKKANQTILFIILLTTFDELAPIVLSQLLVMVGINLKPWGTKWSPRFTRFLVYESESHSTHWSIWNDDLLAYCGYLDSNLL